MRRPKTLSRRCKFTLCWLYSRTHAHTTADAPTNRCPFENLDCIRINVAVPPGTSAIEPRAMGIYTRMDIKRFDRPVFKHFSGGGYLFYCVNGKSSGWYMGRDFDAVKGTIIAHGQNEMAPNLVPLGVWKEGKGDGSTGDDAWQRNNGLTVTCADAGTWPRTS